MLGSLLGKYKNLVQILLLLLFGALLVWYFFNNLEDFRSLANINISSSFIILALQLSVVVVNAWFLRIILKTLGLSLPFAENLAVTAYSSVANFFGFLQTGAGVRAVYLKKKHGLSYKDFFITYLGNYLIIFLISAVIATVALILKAFSGEGWQPWLLITFMVIALAMIAFLFFPQPNFAKNTWLGKRIGQATLGWSRISKQRRVLLKLFLLALLQVTITVILFGFELKIVGVSPPLLSIVLFAAISAFSVLIGLTPGAIGLRESLLIFAQNSLNITTSAIIATSIIDRSLNFIMLIGLFTAIRYSHYRKLTQLKAG